MSYYGAPYQSPYVSSPLPPPAPMPGQYDEYAPSPNIQYAEPGSPLVYPVSPTGGMSPIHSRDSSRDRRNTLDDGPYIRVPENRGGEKMYHSSHLVVAAGLSRSNSERSRRDKGSSSKGLVYVEVAKNAKNDNRGRHGRSTSVGGQYYYDDNGKRYHHDAGSVYSNSSYGSRGHSRSHSKARHSRSPSCASCDSYEDHHPESAMAPYRPKAHEENLSEKLRKVQLQLEQVHAEADKRKKEEEDAKLERLRNEEIERKVSEQLTLQKKREAEAAAEAKRKEDAERAKIQAEAQKILEERERAEQAKRAAEEAEKAKIQAIIDAERQKYEALNRGRRTYTKFSKVHLCKEALDERNIAYTEESEHFLVHRVVDKTEQNYLWGRTKEIRNYYRQIQEAADRAPTVRTTDGSYVKYVQIAGQPNPIALPVTFTQTPGGGQTQRVDPIKIKWSDIFRPQKF